MRRVWYMYDKKNDLYYCGDTIKELADQIGKTTNAILKVLEFREKRKKERDDLF